MLDARRADRRRRVSAEVARLGPEVLEVGRVQHRHIVGNQNQGPSAPGDVVEPRPGREARPGGLLQRGVLLIVQPGVGVTASARLKRIDDRRPLVPQHSESVHPDGEAIGDGLRRAHHVRNKPVPYAGRHLRARKRLVSPATPAIEIAIGAVRAVDFLRNHTRELRGLGVDPVAPNRRVSLTFGRPLRPSRVLATAHVRLHRVATARHGKRHIARRRLLAGEQLVGRLKEASLVLPFRWEAERELGVGAGETSVDVEVARLERRRAAMLRRNRAGEHRRVRRLVAPLPGVDVGLIEAGVLRIRSHEQGALFVRLRAGQFNTSRRGDPT